MKSASGEAKKKTVSKSQMTNKLALGFAAQDDRVIAADVDEAAAEATTRVLTWSAPHHRGWGRVGVRFGSTGRN
ncbi:hypothetical protein [Mycobacterium sp.]|uniref:hypothetical protein n=1 Tax=Mycobacterium sp. TaxID=1785 RepID=UPI003C793956